MKYLIDYKLFEGLGTGEKYLLKKSYKMLEFFYKKS
jgi:hypothetical protein